MARVEAVDINRYPLDGDRILRQGKNVFIAVGQGEIDKLPDAQKKAVGALPVRAPLFGFLNTTNGTLVFTEGDAPIVAVVNKKGEVEKLVD